MQCARSFINSPSTAIGITLQEFIIINVKREFSSDGEWWLIASVSWLLSKNDYSKSNLGNLLGYLMCLL